MVLFLSGHVICTWPERIFIIRSSKLSRVCSRVAGRISPGVGTGLISMFLNCSINFVFSLVNSNTSLFSSELQSSLLSLDVVTESLSPFESSCPFTPFCFISGNCTLFVVSSEFCVRVLETPLVFLSPFVSLLPMLGKPFTECLLCSVLAPVSEYLVKMSLLSMVPLFWKGEIVKSFIFHII